MLPRTIASYGGKKQNAAPVVNPETDLSAEEHNRVAEDVAQMTITAARAIVMWPLTNGATEDPDPLLITIWSVWGSGPAQKPAIDKTASGLYTLTWPATFTDSLDVIENVAFSMPVQQAIIANTNNSDEIKVKTIAGNVVTVASLRDDALFNPAVTGDAYGVLGLR